MADATTILTTAADKDGWRVIVASPDWNKELREIVRTSLPPLSSTALLFLWRPPHMQQEALDVLRMWGFTLKSELIWRKTKGHEGCIVGARGRVHFKDKSIKSASDVAQASFIIVNDRSDERIPYAFFGFVKEIVDGPYYIVPCGRIPEDPWGENPSGEVKSETLVSGSDELKPFSKEVLRAIAGDPSARAGLLKVAIIDGLIKSEGDMWAALVAVVPSLESGKPNAWLSKALAQVKPHAHLAHAVGEGAPSVIPRIQVSEMTQEQVEQALTMPKMTDVIDEKRQEISPMTPEKKSWLIFVGVAEKIITEDDARAGDDSAILKLSYAAPAGWFAKKEVSWVDNLRLKAEQQAAARPPSAVEECAACARGEVFTPETAFKHSCPASKPTAPATAAAPSTKKRGAPPGGVRICGKCGAEGHNKRTCPNVSARTDQAKDDIIEREVEKNTKDAWAIAYERAEEEQEESSSLT